MQPIYFIFPVVQRTKLLIIVLWRRWIILNDPTTLFMFCVNLGDLVEIFAPGPQKPHGGPDVRYSGVSLHTSVPTMVSGDTFWFPKLPRIIVRSAQVDLTLNVGVFPFTVSANARGQRVGFPAICADGQRWSRIRAQSGEFDYHRIRVRRG